MAPKWIGFLVFIWVVAAIIGSIPVGESLVLNSTVTNPAQSMLSYITVWSEQDYGMLSNPFFQAGFWGDLFKIMILDLPIFGEPSSPWQILRWLILGPIIATVVFGVVALFVNMLRRNV